MKEFCSVDVEKHVKNLTFSPRPLTFLPLKSSRFFTHALKNVNTEIGLLIWIPTIFHSFSPKILVLTANSFLQMRTSWQLLVSNFTRDLRSTLRDYQNAKKSYNTNKKRCQHAIWEQTRKLLNFFLNIYIANELSQYIKYITSTNVTLQIYT